MPEGRRIDSAWTSAAIETLRMLWDQGRSAREIALGLATILPGVTRNAVIGKVHRLGLPSRPSPIRTLPPARRGLPGLKDLTECMCRWPIGHPGAADFHFCGGERLAGSSYCAAHRAIAYPARPPRAESSRNGAPKAEAKAYQPRMALHDTRTPVLAG